MKCNECGFENSDSAKFCSKCGNSLMITENYANSNNGNNYKYVIIGLIAVIIILIASVGYLVIQDTSSNDNYADELENNAVESSEADNAEPAETTSVSQTQSIKSKSWVSIGSYSGSGSGSQTIDVPAGDIMIKLSAYPIKNYATNHLYVTGSNGASGGVDWGSKSAVETRSDSFTYSSSAPQTFTIDYYETVEWEVEFYSYQ